MSKCDCKYYRQKGKLIVIDAGHGGKDSGALSLYGDKEKDFTLRDAFIFKKELERLGYRVVLLRDKDNYITTNKRAEISNQLSADLFISIHYNWALRKKAHGFEVLYHHNSHIGKKLATEITANVGVNYPIRAIKQKFWIRVLRKTIAPALLLEMAFLSNKKDLEQAKNLVATRMKIQDICQAVQKNFN